MNTWMAYILTKSHLLTNCTQMNSHCEKLNFFVTLTKLLLSLQLCP